MLNGNALKLIAAFTMLLDHIGHILFPQVLWLRIVGRLAFPIYAFMIAEGCKYTRSKKRYLGLIAGLAAICQIVYYLFDGSLYFSILTTFSLSIVTIYALDYAKENPGTGSFLLFCGCVVMVWLLNREFTIDYGFLGCMTPVLASLSSKTEFDHLPARVGTLGIGLLLMYLTRSTLQIYSLLALPLLLCYNGKRGKWNLKYFFYIFYPVHLVILEGIAMLMGR